MAERRTTARARVALPCRLQPRTSSAIWAETIDVSEGGMSVRATRPLPPDELVDFQLDAAEGVEGQARVTRHHSPRVYALRFEGLRPPMLERLAQLVAPR